MGFPTKNSDDTPFREENEYIKTLEAEIETLQKELEKANKRRQRWANTAARKVMEKDEWKRRATHLRDWVKHMHGIGIAYVETDEIDFGGVYITQFPEAKDWFEEG